ncbi:MAG: alpha-galactosidase [Ruminococcus sp.]|uniref:Alpha-galactosidase n=1 Tax=Schaedlerella arabinosiphila TaxID=2044587 RepID=A0A3R8JNQ7_9FIRM|nr:alpha-galactosidase [Schaedlerella arabinosiphila]MCI8722769.1 alpha-galactosidase [Ruminococcus sp.]RRK32563.1 alpha-galactosidase [Schaedlerella arabinosiphila]
MSIIFNEQAKTFTLQTAHTSYQMKIGNLDYLLHLYYGPSICDADLNYQIMQYDRGFSGNPYESRDARTFSLDAQPQEFSTQQQGDFRTTSIEVVNADGSYSFNGKVSRFTIREGKYQLDTLPCTFAKEDERADTLEIVLTDQISSVEVILLYSVFEKADMITRAVKVVNKGTASIQLKKIMSVCLDFLNGLDMDLVSLPGRYGQERQVERQKMTHHIHTIGSVRGSSSHQQNPFVVLCGREATEDYGKCYGFSLVYSGNFLAEAELDQYDQLRLVMGINPKQFVYEIKPGEQFEGPEVVMAFTEHGFTGLTHLYHDFYRTNLCRSKFVSEVQRPVLINSWEAAFMDFDDVKLVEIAKAAKNMGVDMLVMDDGWFGKRDDDNSGLGDWVVNEEKIKGGLHKLVEQINNLGMKFGIWFEPEMVSEDSDLYRAHPEWAMQIPGRHAVRSRNQMALDMSRKEVQDYLIQSVNAILDDANIYYVKWDINRSLADIWSNVLSADKQGEVYHRYILGLYRVMNEIILTHPDILFEGCSGGGGRYDPGMLHYYPQYWVSDNNNPIDRLKLHYGTSFVYPISTMGAHISDSGRFVPLRTKAVVAMCGTFGYELDASKLSEEEQEICREQSDLFRKYYPIIFGGDYYRLSNPFEVGNMTAWQHVTKDKAESLLSVVVTNLTCNGPQEYVKAKGLIPDAMYRINNGEQVLSGAALMYAGLPIDREVPEYSSFQFYLKQI